MSVTTTFLAAIMTLWSAVGNVPTSHWQPDYWTAVHKAAETKKPLAVFIGHGKVEKTQLITEGGIGEVETKALMQEFISLYVDVDTEAGKKLAQSFEITEGVVISDRTGSLQAVLHEGTVTKTELNDYLTRYAEPSKTVTTTEFGGRRRPIAQFLNDPNRHHPVASSIQNVSGFFSGST